MDAPAPYPCIDHGQKLEAMQASLNRIEMCLTGDAKLRQRGLVERVDDHDDRLKRLERWAVTLVGAGGGIALLWEVLTKLAH